MAEIAAPTHRNPARWLGTVSQGSFLRALGVEARAAALAARVPSAAEEVRLGMERLIDADQMGELFKVMGLAAPSWPEAAGFYAG